MDSLEDYQINNSTLSCDSSENILLGDKCHVGIIPLLVFKYKVLRRWVSYSFTVVWISPQYVASLQEKTKTHSDCFAAMNVDADHSWLGKLRPSAVVAFRLLEAFLHGVCWQVCCFVWLRQIVTDLCNLDRQLPSRGPSTMS